MNIEYDIGAGQQGTTVDVHRPTHRMYMRQFFTDALVKWFLTTFLCLLIVLMFFVFTVLPED